MQAPDLFAYTDFRDFLRDWFAHRKAANPRFSHRLFARRLGSSDPSVLSNLISGRRRLSEARIAPMAAALGLDAPEARYFELLVAFGQAEGREAQERAWASLVQHRLDQQGPGIDRDHLRYLSSWHFAAIRTLAECEHFQPDPTWIAQTLRPRIEPGQAAEALSLLERLGFLVREGDTLVPADPVLHTSEIVGRLGSYGYHRDSHHLAGQTLEHLLEPRVADETAFLGLTVAVPEHRLPQLRKLLWEAQLQVLHRCEAWTEPRDRVAQVNIQMFPISASAHAEE